MMIPTFRQLFRSSNCKRIAQSVGFAFLIVIVQPMSLHGQDQLVMPDDKAIAKEKSKPDRQEPNATPVDVSVDQVTAAKIKEFLSQVENASDLEPESLAAVKTIISQASDELARSSKLDSSAKQDRIAVEGVPARLEALQNEISAAAKTGVSLPPESASLQELESSLASLLVRTQEAKNRVTSLQAEQSRRADRRKQIVVLQASHGQRVAEAEQQLAAESPAGESTWSATARKMLQAAKLQSLELELPANQWELARYDAEQAVDLYALKSKQAMADVAAAENAVAELGQRIDQSRKNQARSQVKDLRRLAESIDSPELAAMALRSAELAEENEEVVSSIGNVTTQSEASQIRLDTLLKTSSRTRERLERVGLSGAIGLELRKQLSLLPDIREIRRDVSARQETMQDVELKRLDREDELTDASQVQLSPEASGLEKQIQSDRVAVLQSLSKNYNLYFQQLSDLDFNEHQLILASESYRSFLNEHVLWIRSNSFFGWQSLKEAVGDAKQLLQPSSWKDVATSLWIDAFIQPWLYGLALLATLLLMPARYRGRNHLAEFGKIAARPTCTEFSVTIRAALMTVVMAIAWPAVAIFIGWRLVASPHAAPFSIAWGHALVAAGVVLTLFNVVRHACREHGLAASHFGWPTRVTQMLRSKMRRLRFLLIPLVLMVVMLRELGGIDGVDGGNNLERLCMIMSLLILSWTLRRILNPSDGAAAEYLRRNPNAWFTRTSGLWSWCLIGFPLVMVVLIFVGFFYTATELTWRFWHMIWIAVSLVVVRAMVIRALQVNHRKLGIRKMKERRAAQLQAAAQATGDTPGQAAKPVPVEQNVTGEGLSLENEHDALRANSEQVIRIMNSSLMMSGLLLMWFLWSGLFPALGILNQVELWNTEREVVVETPAENGGVTRVTETQVEPITLVNLLGAALIGLITFTLVRNVPGLIEITILQRLPLEASFKFAIVTMCRYVILVVGMLFAFSAIGANWSKLQWLVAALTVGLGFGLQEIFGNFVSGIIILWERPIRIGDVVTLDSVSGTVSRIQMRATTIMDWDRKEYIVPNKDFVTGRLLNWTRSDQVSRIVIPVGVAYGMDVRLGLRLLLQVADENSKILKDPIPAATFDNFGDSTLNLTLRCFVPSLEGRLDTISDLNLAIDDEFAKAGIEIAFPQQDVHIRSAPQQFTFKDLASDPSTEHES
ncbi:MAG: mechanosensitive ion channel domain-containing protein [Rubripirellula sp.]